MTLLQDCSKQKLLPWLHYIVHDYFDQTLLNDLLNEINHFAFKKAKDDFRDEFNLNYNTNNSTVKLILDNFLQKDNINFISSIDDRIKNNTKLLRASIWKDYKGFNLPMHTDCHFKLFTMQIYLPRNDELEYGTTYYDQNGKLIKKTDYKLNHGYFFFPNINKIKTNHSFVEDIKTERCSIVFNIFDKEYYTKKNKNTINEKFLSCIDF